MTTNQQSDRDALIHDARNALAAARAQVDLMLRRIDRDDVVPHDLGRGLEGARGSLLRLGVLIDAMEELPEAPDAAATISMVVPNGRPVVFAHGPARPHS